MKDIKKLYDQVKNIKGIDMALIDAYISVILKKSGCSSIEELVELVYKKERKAAALHDSSTELNKKIFSIMEEERQLLSQQMVLKDEAVFKSTVRVLLPIIGVMGIGAACVTIFFNLPSVVLAVIALLVAAKVGLSARDRIWSEFNLCKARYDELCSQDATFSEDLNENLFASLNLNSEINDLGKIFADITTFLETYISVTEKVDPESLVQDTTLEDDNVEEVLAPEEGKRRILG